jgi:adenosylcobinamide-phosphate guanylyltransferase
MCGGRGSRLDADCEKPLFEIDGRPMIDRVLAALTDSDIDTVHAAVSPQTPETSAHLEDRSVSRLQTPGEGYVSDLDAALETVGKPVLTVVSDLPLLSASLVDRILDTHDTGSLAVYTPVPLKRQLGLSVDITLEGNNRELTPAGLNIVADGAEHRHVSYDVRLAVNVNRLADAEIAEAIA